MDNQELLKLIELGNQDFRKGNYKQAIESFQEALEIYTSLGDELNSAEMSNNLSVSFLQNKQPEEALQAALGTDLTFMKHNKPVKQAIALGNQAAAYEALRKYSEAHELYEKSADLLKEAGESELRSHVLKALSAIELRKGKHLESIFNMQRSLDSVEKPTLWQRISRAFLKLPFRFIGK